jgi:hypothetical protein
MNGTETPLTKYVISRVFEIIVKVCPVRLASSSGHNLITKNQKMEELISSSMGRKGRKGKSGPLFFSFFPFLPFLPSGTIYP